MAKRTRKSKKAESNGSFEEVLSDQVKETVVRRKGASKYDWDGLAAAVKNHKKGGGIRFTCAAKSGNSIYTEMKARGLAVRARTLLDGTGYLVSRKEE